MKDRTVFILIAIISVGIFLRILDLGGIVFYWDEPLHTVRIAAQPLPFVAAYNDGSFFMALFVHLLLGLGKMEVTSRIPSLLFGILTIPLVFSFGRRFLNRSAGLWAAALVAFSPSLIQYSMYSRMYASYVFLSLLTAGFLYFAVIKDRRCLWIGYAATLSVGIWNHIGGLLALPAFFIFAVFIWLERGWTGRKERKRPSLGWGPLLRFGVWTMVGTATGALLILPNKSLWDFIGASILRAAGQLQTDSATGIALPSILQEILGVTNPIWMWIFIAVAALGFVLTARRRPRVALFGFLYTVVPVLVFVLARPNEVTALSAPRYFLTAAPFFFLYIGKALEVLLSGPSPVTDPSQARMGNRFRYLLQPVRIALLPVVFIIIIGAGFDHRPYEGEFRRLGTLSLAPDTRSRLEEIVRSDGFLLIDSAPTSGMVLVVNPLTRNLKLEEIDLAIRNNLEVPSDRYPLLIYRLFPNMLRLFALMRIPLWVITVDGAENILTFDDPRMELREKLRRATEELLSLPGDPGHRGDRFYLAAWSQLLMGATSEALRNLAAAEREERALPRLSLPRDAGWRRIYDRMAGLSVSELKARHFRRFRNTIAFLLLEAGDELRRRNKLREAYRTYRSCVRLSSAYREQCTVRLETTGNRLLRESRFAEAALCYTLAVRLHPERFELRIMWAETLLRCGRLDESLNIWRAILFGRNTKEGSILSDGPVEKIDTPVTDLDGGKRTLTAALKTQYPLLLSWRNGRRWTIVLRSDRLVRVEGTITAAGGLKNVDQYFLAKRDLMEECPNGVKIDMAANRGVIKVISFKTRKRARLSFSLRFNGQLQPGSILLLTEASK
ncbi:MAG: glycosyltransferase family 39 protein [Candidatus Aminicenantes bacterium]|nr:glycosyltransferase family 39 protein [Candidatus Aminicenantes bacterium]